MVRVLHKNEDNGQKAARFFLRQDYTHVADVDVPDAEHWRVFPLTNHFLSRWQKNEGVHPIGAARFQARSKSIGDVVELSDGRLLVYTSRGWESISRVDPTPPPPIDTEAPLLELGYSRGMEDDRPTRTIIGELVSSGIIRDTQKIG